MQVVIVEGMCGYLHAIGGHCAASNSLDRITVGHLYLDEILGVRAGVRRVFRVVGFT